MVIALLAACGGGSDSDNPPGDTQPASPAGFGQQAGAADRAAATKAVEDFVDAWVKGDAARACGLMSDSTRKNLATFASQLGGRGCPDQADTVRSAMSAKLRSQLEGIRVTGVRVDDDRGVVIYRAAGRSWAIPVSRSGSGWKVGAIRGQPVQ